MEFLKQFKKSLIKPSFYILMSSVILLVITFQNCEKSDTRSSDTTTTVVTTSSYSEPSEIESISSPSVTEGDTAVITITVSNTSSSERVFMYKNVNGTAYDGYNYTGSSGTITFSAYQTSATISISTINNGYSDGNNYFYVYIGQLDLTDQEYKSSKITILDVDSIQTNKLATGLYHTCAINSYGSLSCWGYNNYGQVGDGSNVNYKYPQELTGLNSDVTAVAAGAYHTCAIISSGLKCWGLNSNGQLGVGNTSNYSAPKSVSSMGSVTAVSAGSDYTCAVSDGSLYCWGKNNYGQLGVGSTTSSSTAVAVSTLSTGVSYVSAGYTHACAIKDKTLYCWGLNSNGELGDGTKTNQTTPQPVSGMEDNVTDVSAGYDYTCAVQSNKVKCWGANARGQLGTSDTTPHVAPFYNGISDAMRVYTNMQTTCALTTSGELECWGYNGYGQVGTESSTGSITAANKVHSSEVIDVSLGHGYHVCDTFSSNLYCWGYNYYGQLGLGSTTSQNKPQRLDY